MVDTVKISELSALTDLATNDIIAAVDVSDPVSVNKTKRVTLSTLRTWITSILDGRVTTVENDISELLNPPNALVGLLGNASVPSGTPTIIAWQSNIRISHASMHSTSVNPERLTAPKSGVYRFYLNGQFAVAVDGFRWMAVRDKNGNQLAIEDRDGAGNTSRYISIGGEVYLAANDYVYAQVYQNSGGNLNFAYAHAGYPNFSLTFVRN